MSKRGIIGFLTALSWTAQFANGQLQPDCNPLHTDCPSKKAWPEENYYIDFTKQKGPPSDWTIANSEVVDFTSNGAELSYAKKGDAPNMWTDFYMLGGRYDVEMKIAPGQGVISSAALWSDTQDEIDFEFSGNQFGQTPFPPRDGMWAFETNVFAQGKMWDGAATYQKDLYKPAEQFHKYSVEWDEDYMNWYVDDKVVRSILAKDTPKGFAFPQSPMKLQLGVWGGGDPNNNHWTIQWAGGEVDMKGAPYTMYVKSVNITNKYPACQYRYKDKSGKQASIEKLENGCNPELVKMAKRDPAANNYPVSSPESVASEVGSSTPANYPTYDASSPSTSQLPTTSSSQPLDTYPTSLLSSSDDLSTSSPVEYPTYSASLPSTSDQSISSLVGYPTGEVETSSVQLSSSVASGYPTSPAGSSSVVVSSSASSLAETFETYPALSPPSASVPSASVSSASVSSASSLSLSSAGVPSSSTVDGYPTQPLTESGTVSTQTSATTAPGGYPVSSLTTSSGILSSLSSLFLGTTTSSSVSTQTDSSIVTGSTSTTELTESSSVQIASSSVDAASSSASLSSQASGSSYLASSPSASSASVSSIPGSLSSVTQPGTSSIASGTIVSYSESVGSASSSTIGGSSNTISTIYSSTIYTVTSCAPTVTNCPVGKVTTESVSVSTTTYPVSQSQPITSSTLSDTSVETQPSSYVAISSATVSSATISSADVSSVASSYMTISSGSAVLPTTESGISYFTYPTSGGPLFSQTLPSTYSVSSEITKSILSTVYSTNVVTITSCAASVTNCPVGQVTTETISAYTTICPVTQTILDGITYGIVQGTEATALPPPSSSAYPASSSSLKPVESVSLSGSSSLYPTTSVISSAIISSSVLGSSNIYPTASSGISVGSSSSIISSSIIFQNSTISTSESTFEGSSQTYPASSIPASSTETSMTTSTVYSTNIYTITSCAPGVTNCPAQLGQVTTDLISLYTTVCPVTESQTTIDGSSSVLPVATQTSAPGQTISSYATMRNSTSAGAIPSSSVSAPIQSSVTQDVPSYSMSTESGPLVESSTSQAASSYATSAQFGTEPASYTTSTIYSTNVYTVTSCAPGVTNCPTNGAVTTEIIAVSTTVCPVADNSKDTPGTTVSAVASQYTTTAITLSDTVSGSVIVITTTVSFIDTPAPTSYYPTQGIGTSNTAGTDAIASSAPGAYPNITKPGTTVTLGNYFTTVIEYDTITPEAPASVSSGATPTSYYTASQASTDVSSYQMSESSSTVGTATTSVPVAVSSASSYPVASSQTAPKNAPGESSHVDNDLTTVTSPTTDTRTVFQTQSPEKSGTCECVPSTVTVTQTVARVTVTSTAEPFIASTYSMGTAPLGTGATTTNAYPMSTPAAIRRWFRRGHGNGGEHGH